MSPWADEPRTATWPTRPWFKGIGAVLVPLIIFVAFPLTGCRAPASARDPRAAMKDALAKARVQKTSPAEKLEKALDGIEGALARAKRKVKARKNASKDLKALAGFAADIGRIDSEVKAEFAKTRGVLAKIKSREKDAIQAKVEREYAAKMRHLASALSSITEPAPGTSTATRDGQLSAMTALSSWIDTMTPEPPHQPLGTELPHRIVDYKAGPPTLGTAIAPAYAPNTPGAIASTLPVTPTAEDLTQTVEVQFTEDISATANELGRDPVKLYEFVRNTMDYEPYYGSRKGANETLWEKAGNDFDQASLLIALYRCSGIPARYVYGVVEIPIEKAMNWVGVEVPEAAAKLFSAAGVPVKAGMSGGKIVKLQIEHCWVEAYVPYESYRGVAAGPRAAKKKWVALDPSWKRYEGAAAVDVWSEAGVDATALATEVAERVSVDTTAGLLTIQDATAAAGAIEAARSRLAAHLATQTADKHWEMTGYRRIVERRLGLLPAVLPMADSTAYLESRAVPGDLKERLTIDGGGLHFDAPLSEVAGSRISFSYGVRTEDDAALLAAHESIEEIPAYLLKVTPTLRVDGRVAALGDTMTLASVHPITIGVRRGAADLSSSTDLLSSGGYYVLGVHFGDPARPAALRQVAAVRDVSGLVQHGDATAAVNRVDDLIGGFLALPLANYFGRLAEVEKRMARVAGVRAFAQTSLGLTGFSTATDSMFGMPAALVPRGLFLDVDSHPLTVFSRQGSKNAEAAYTLAVGALGSMLEHQVWEELSGGTVQAVSAIKLIRAAAAQGVPIRMVTSANAAALVGGLALSQAVRQEILDAAAAGHLVVVPAREIAEAGWRGSAYAVIDPATGSSGFMISGGLGGSETTLDEVIRVSGQAMRVALAGFAMGGVLAANKALENLAAIVPFAAAVGSYWMVSDRIWDSPFLSQQDKIDLQIQTAMMFMLNWATVQLVLVASWRRTLPAPAIAGINLGLQAVWMTMYESQIGAIEFTEEQNYPCLQCHAVK